MPSIIYSHGALTIFPSDTQKLFLFTCLSVTLYLPLIIPYPRSGIPTAQVTIVTIQHISRQAVRKFIHFSHISIAILFLS